MSDLLQPMLVVVLRKLPVVVSLVVDNALTTPIMIEETVEKAVKASTFDLVKALREEYPNELKLLGVVDSHCEKGMYLLLEGELRVFTLAQAPIALKRIMDTCRDIGLSVTLRGALLDIIVDDTNEYDWLD